MSERSNIEPDNSWAQSKNNPRFYLSHQDAIYVRRSVGMALQECIAEIIQVRPQDPIEYMGLWLRHHMLSQNYFRHKKEYLCELVDVMNDKKRMKHRFAKDYSEAVTDITRPIAELQLQDKKLTEERKSSGKDESSAMELAKLQTKLLNLPSNMEILGEVIKGSELVSSELVLSGQVDSRRATAMIRKEQLSEQRLYGSSADTESQSREKRKSVARDASDSSELPSRRDSSSTNSRNEVEGARKSISGKLNRRASKTAKSLGVKRRQSQTKNVAQVTGILPTQDAGTVEVTPVKWRVTNNQIACYHPVLGVLSVAAPRSGGPCSQWDIFLGKPEDPWAAQSSYDPETYTTCSEVHAVPGSVADLLGGEDIDDNFNDERSAEDSLLYLKLHD